MPEPNTQIKQSSRGHEVQEGHQYSETYPVKIYRPRRWQSNLIFGVAGAIGVGGFIWLLWASAAYAEIVSPINFMTTGCLALFLVVVAVAQFGLYWSQRDFMNAQWNTMERSLEAINKQEVHLSAQATAAKDAAEAAEHQAEMMLSQAKYQRSLADATVTQATIMAQSIQQTRELIIQNERAIQAAEKNVETVEKTAIYANRAYVVAKIRDTGPYDDQFMFRLRIVNNGNTPANDVVVSFSSGLREKPPHEETPDGPVVYDIGFTETERLGLISATGSYHVIETPKVSYPFQHVHPHEHALWETGGLKFYCWGRIVYEDIFNEKRHTDFCFVLSQEHPKGYPCKHGNEAY